MKRCARPCSVAGRPACDVRDTTPETIDAAMYEKFQIDIKKLSRSIQKKSRQVMDAQSRLRDLQDQNESLLDRLENIDAQNEAQINSIFTSCKAGSQATENMFSSFHSHHSSSQASELMVNSMCEENPGAHANEKFGVPRSLICEISGDDFLSTRTEFVQSGASSLHNVCTATGASVGECSANTPSGSLQQLVKQFRCDSRGLWGAAGGSCTQQSLTDYACHASVSISDVVASCPEATAGNADIVENNSDQNDWFRKAVDFHIRTVATQRHVSVSDVCWFVQLPYEVSSETCLSASSTVCTPECILSGSLTLNAVSIELMFLIAESGHIQHQIAPECCGPHAQNAGGEGRVPSAFNSCMGAEESGLDASAFVSKAPDAELLQWIQVRCGVAGSVSLSDVCTSVVHGMLRQHECTLPFSAWRSACIRGMRWLHGTIQNILTAAPQAVEDLVQRMHERKSKSECSQESSRQSRSTGDSGGTNGGLGLVDIKGAMVVSCQAMLCEMHAVLQDASEIEEVRKKYKATKQVQVPLQKDCAASECHAAQQAQQAPHQTHTPSSDHSQRGQEAGPTQHDHFGLRNGPFYVNKYQSTQQQVEPPQEQEQREQQQQGQKQGQQQQQQDEGQVDQEEQEQLLKELRGRIVELIYSFGLLTCIAFITCPHTMFLNWSGIAITDTKGLRRQLKAISKLDLDRKQVHQHAAGWHNWVRKRKVLSRRLAETLSHLQCHLPSLEDIEVPLHLVSQVLAETPANSDHNLQDSDPMHAVKVAAAADEAHTQNEGRIMQSESLQGSERQFGAQVSGVDMHASDLEAANAATGQASATPPVRSHALDECVGISGEGFTPQEVPDCVCGVSEEPKTGLCGSEGEDRNPSAAECDTRISLEGLDLLQSRLASPSMQGWQHHPQLQQQLEQQRVRELGQRQPTQQRRPPQQHQEQDQRLPRQPPQAAPPTAQPQQQVLQKFALQLEQRLELVHAAKQQLSDALETALPAAARSCHPTPQLPPTTSSHFLHLISTACCSIQHSTPDNPDTPETGYLGLLGCCTSKERQQTVHTCSVKPLLLGCGEDARAISVAEAALQQLVEIQHSEAMLFDEARAPPYCHLTAVQQAKCLGDRVRTGLPSVDHIMLKRACAHDDNWAQMLLPASIFL